MKKLSEVQLMSISLRPSLRGSETAKFIEEADLLSVGEGLLVERREWPLKNFPTKKTIQQRVKQDKKFAVRHLIDGTGFVIVRLG